MKEFHMPIVQLPKGRLISMAELTSITAAGYQPDARTYTVIDHQHPAAKGTYSPQQQVKGMHRVALVMAINDGTVKARSLFTGVVYGEREPIDSDWERTSKAYGLSYREAVKFCELVEIDVDDSTPQAIIPSPAPVEAVGASSAVQSANTESGWKLKTLITRSPGYRWPLYQFMKKEHLAGRSCPRAQHVLDAWKSAPPNGVKVIQTSKRDELEYELDTGKKKIATIKNIQATIQGLLSK